VGPVFKELGFLIGWDSKTQVITGTKNDLKINLKLGSKIATVNGKQKTLLVAPVQINGYTYIPLRFVGEASGKSVNSENVDKFGIGGKKGVWVQSKDVRDVNNNIDPITFDLSHHIMVSKVDDDYNKYIDFDSRETRIEINSIGTPELKLVACNNTSKDIVSFEFECSFTDSFDRPVYKTGTKNKLYKGIVQNTKLYNNYKNIEDFTMYDEYINNYIDKYSSLIGTETYTEDSLRKTAISSLQWYSDSVYSQEYTFNLVLHGLATNIDSLDIKLLKVKYSDGSIWNAK